MTMTENRLTAERQHEIRYDVQQYFIPEMVECIKDGYLLPISAVVHQS